MEDEVKREQTESMSLKKKKKIPIWLPITIVAALIIAIVAGVVVYSNSPAQRLKRQLSLGEKYLSELDYEEAVAAFTAALEIDPDSRKTKKALAGAYLEWGTALLEDGDREQALEILREGYELTENKKIAQQIADIEETIRKEKEAERQAREDEKKKEEEELRPEDEGDASAALWKHAYADLINGNHPDSSVQDWSDARFLLAYADDDDTPELIVYLESASFDEVYSFSGDSAWLAFSHGYGTWGRGPLSFYERTGYMEEWSYYYPSDGYTASNGEHYGDEAQSVTLFQIELRPMMDPALIAYYSTDIEVYDEASGEMTVMDVDDPRFFRTDPSYQETEISRQEYEQETGPITRNTLVDIESAVSYQEILDQLR